MNPFQEFIATSRYCRWLDGEQRRETWFEAVTRYTDWIWKRVPDSYSVVKRDIHDSILNLRVMPSMRALMTAGPAADRDNVCCYNCAYTPINDIASFKELMYILMCGTGVGYSVEQHEISKLPRVPNEITRDEDRIIVVEDSKEGWCAALHRLMVDLFNGIHPTWDLTYVRREGERLKTFGGRASGPEPLNAVFKFVVKMLYSRQGARLSDTDCSDICCVIARSIIVGGVRRSAMICLSDLSSRDMARYKSGAWWEAEGYRSLANISAVYDGRPSMVGFLEEWQTIYESRAGERGIFNREAAIASAADCGRDLEVEYGTNPCVEILLKPHQFCNLSEAVIRPDDNMDTIREKVRLATILGTIQSTLTYFPNLRPEWKQTCEEERLLGVSLTGIFDNTLTSIVTFPLQKFLRELNRLVEETNIEWARILGIQPSKARCCVKPSGTVACLVHSGSGIHPWYAPYFIRRVRIDKKDPLYDLLKAEGVPVEDCVRNPANTAVFSFVLRAPEGARTTFDLPAREHLELWKLYKKYWCDHNPSCTISYTDEEFLDIGSWVWKNFDEICGLSFLPRDEHTYEQAPFEQITQEEYENWPDLNINWSRLSEFEIEDQTNGVQELACTGQTCEVVDLAQE